MSDEAIQSCVVTASGRFLEVGDPSARFPYWSFSKTVIAICAMRFAARGVLDLDAPMTGEAFTLRQLLQHRAGVRNYGDVPEYHTAVAAGERPWSRARILEATHGRGPAFAPGASWDYSNVGYMFAREAVEAAAGMPFAEIVAAEVTGPLGLASVRYAQTQADFAGLYWPQAALYHPGWVYHGCLTGTARDAAMLLQALFDGRLLAAQMLAQMQDVYPLGGAIAGRPWVRCGYGAGLMSGAVAGADPVEGHSGAGPFCVNAVYHFAGLPDPVTVASFAGGCDEGVPEFEAVRLAMEVQG